MSRFVRASKFRHVFGTAAKRDLCYDNIRVSANAWDTNVIKVNPLFISVNWNSAGGGAFAVIPLSQVGKLPDNYPLYRGHTAPVLDTDFANFNDYVVASAAEDTKIFIYNIPEQYAEEHYETGIEPTLKLGGHGRKVGHVLFHPVADNILASSSTDLTVKLWDIEKGVEKQELSGHPEIIQSLVWNWNGSLLATTCRDKKLRIFDVRANKIVQHAESHPGVKGSRVVWLGDLDRLVTTGFSKMSDRQMNIWDTSSMDKPLKSTTLDSSSGVVMPFYDHDTKMLYLAGKGDGNIRYYEYEHDDLFPLSEYKSSEPQRGMAFLPKRAVNVNECEIVRAYKVSNTLIEPISFTVPRRSDAFQSDLYPPTIGDSPSLTADEFFNGKDAAPKLINLDQGFTVAARKEFISSAPKNEENGNASASSLSVGADGPKLTEKDFQGLIHTLQRDNEDLKRQVTQRDVRIRQLEAQLEEAKEEVSKLQREPNGEAEES